MQNYRIVKDTISHKIMFCITAFSASIVFFMAIGLILRSLPILSEYPITELLFSSSWHPLRGQFGFLPFIMGTLWVTLLSIVIAFPLCLLTSIHLAEYAPSKFREFCSPFIDLLAGIPSVIFGIWGILVIVPLIKNYIAPLFGVSSTGYSVLAAGIVLAIMIFPIIIHVSIEVLRAIPFELREASLSLGATQWQTIKKIVVRKGLPGIIAAFVLGLSRAFGETMAVLMVAGNVVKEPKSIFDPSYPLPALIANNYGEMLSIPMYDSALLFASFVLLMIVLLFNIISRLILIRIVRKVQ